MFEIIPNWHPIFVHFTVALLSISALLLIVARFVPEPLAQQWSIAGRWCLWLGAGFAIITVAAGLYASNTVAHDNPSHAAMEVHETLAISTLVTFLILATWAAWKVRKGVSEALRNGLFLLLLAAGVGLLITTAWHGGELVYRYGLGVQSLPQPENGHDHDHAGSGEEGEENGHQHSH